MRWLAVLFCLFLPFAAAAQDDRDRLTRFLEESLSDAGRTVVVEGFRGALSSRAQIDRLTIADDLGVWLTAEGIVLDWNRLAVLRGDIQINELSARKIVVARPPAPAPGPDLPSPEAAPFALPELPVAIRIARLAAERIELGAPVLGQPVAGTLQAAVMLAGGEGQARVNILRQDDGPEGRIDLDAGFSNASRLLVVALEAVEGPGGIAAGALGLPGEPSAALTVRGSGPLTNFAAEVRLATDGADRLAGQVTLRDSTAEGMRFGAELAGDLAPLFLPDYAAFFGPEVALSAEGVRAPTGRLDLSRLRVTARAVALDGSLLLAADGLPERFALDLRLGMPDGGPVLLPLPGARTEVAAADLTLGYDPAAGEGWRLRGTVQDLSRPDLAIGRLRLDGSGRISRRAGRAGPAAVGGTLAFGAEGLAPADPALAAALGPEVTGRTTFSWAAGDDALRIGALRLAGADYAATARGLVSGLSTGFRLSGSAGVQAADLSRFAALAGRPLAGEVGAELRGEGSPLGGDFDLVGSVQGQGLRIGQAELDALLSGPSSVALSVRRDGTGTALRDLTVTAGAARVSAQGRLASTGSDLSARLALPDLSALGPAWGGALDAEATLQGVPDDLRLTLRGTGRSLRSGRAEIDGLLRGDTALDIDLTRRGDRIAVARALLSNTQGDLRAGGHWDPAGSDLTASVRLADLRVLGPAWGGALSAEARVTGPAEALSLDLRGTGRGLAVGQAEADRLLRGESRVALRLTQAGNRLRIEEARLDNPQLTAQATGAFQNGTRQLEVTARLADLGLILPEFPGALTLAGQLREDAQGYGLDLRAQGPGGIDATARGRLAPGLDRGDLRIAGSAQAGLANAFLGSRAVSGSVTFDLGLNGRFALASLSGPVRLTGGRLADPDLPFALTDLSATAQLAGGRATLQAGAALTTGGRVSVSGGLGLAAPFPADLEIALQGARVRDPELFETVMNGQLRLTGPAGAGGRLTGRIDLGETELRIPSTGLGGGEPLPGLRHVAEPAPVRETRRRAGLLGAVGGGGGPAGGGGGGALALDVTVSAPNRVFLRGRGLDAELGGAVRLQGTTAAIVPSGAFELIRGRLDLLGKRLDLTTARLLLQGALVPYVEVVAANDSGGVTTFVRVEGQADAPEVTFSSTPELPQEEVLARLLFGRDLTSISAFQAAQLASAVATLAGRGGDGIVGRLRKGFGLNDLDITSDGQGETRLRAGKYISRNVYTEVEVGQGGTSRINLNLDLRPGVTLKGTVAEDGEAGIGVFLERDY